MGTLTFDNFRANLTQFPHGNTDSGNAIATTTFGVNNFQTPGCFSFGDKVTNITGGVITDLIIDGQTRVENGIPFVYMIGHTGRLYKSQVTNPSIHAPQYDVVTLITTLTTAISFTMGGTLEFFGSPERIYIGHDKGVTAVEFGGGNETFIGDSSLWVQNVPRQGLIFEGEFFWTNGPSIAVMDNQGNITNYSRLVISPSNEFIVKALGVDVAGKEVIILASNIPIQSILSTSPNLPSTFGGTAIVATWDGQQNTVLSQVSLASFDHTAIGTTGDMVYIFGYDVTGGIISSLDADGLHKIANLLFVQSPMPNATNPNSNLIGWSVPEFNQGTLDFSLFLYGSLDSEYGVTLTRPMRFSSSLSGGDVMRVPWTHIVTNLGFGGTTSGYVADVIGLGRTYLSTVEYNGSTTSYYLYSYPNVPSGTNAINGVYETQAILSPIGTYTPNKITTYIEPAIGTESFVVELIGLGGAVLSGSAVTYTPSAGNTILTSSALTVATSACVGVRVINGTSATPFIHKIEVTY